MARREDLKKKEYKAICEEYNRLYQEEGLRHAVILARLEEKYFKSQITIERIVAAGKPDADP